MRCGVFYMGKGPGDRKRGINSLAFVNCDEKNEKNTEIPLDICAIFLYNVKQL